MKNKIIVLIALIGFTVLLLELPKLYYKISDNNLFLHEGMDHYESVVTSTVSDFSLKIESFFRTNADLATSRIGYANILSEEETNQVMEKISAELKIITGPDEKSVFTEYVFSEEALSYVTKHCFTAHILYRKANEQYVWELGYLDLFSKYNNPFATIIYDTNTYKIIFMTWGIEKYNLVKFRWVPNENIGPFVKEYYAGLSDEVTKSFIDDGLAGEFYPSSVPYHVVDTATLYSDLKELAKGFWFFTYQKQYTLME